MCGLNNFILCLLKSFRTFSCQEQVSLWREMLMKYTDVRFYLCWATELKAWEKSERRYSDLSKKFCLIFSNHIWVARNEFLWRLLLISQIFLQQKKNIPTDWKTNGREFKEERALWQPLEEEWQWCCVDHGNDGRGSKKKRPEFSEQGERERGIAWEVSRSRWERLLDCAVYRLYLEVS